jgi:hypothetical protein
VLCKCRGDPQVEDLQQRGDTTQSRTSAYRLLAKIDQEAPVEVRVRSVKDAREAVDTADSPRQAGCVDEDLLRFGDLDLKVMQLGLLYADGSK